MAPSLKLLVVAVATASVVSGFSPSSSTFGVRQSTQLQESFGFGFAEDTYENQPDLLKGEGEYKQYANRIKSDNMLNRKYNVIGRVRDLELLQKTIDSGLLSKLDAQGLDLATIEKLLPLADKLGVLGLAANNQQVLINGLAPLLVEGAPLLIPVLAGAVGAGPGAFFLAAGAFGGLEAFFVLNDVQIPLVGLSAGVFAGLLLVPLTLVSAAAGAALGGLKK